MQSSSCPKCGHNLFEMVTVQPKNSSFPVALIQCQYCGIVVGAVEAHNVGDAVLNEIRQIKNEIETLSSEIKDIHNKLK